MFVRNRTPYKLVLRTGRVTDETAAAVVVVQAWFRVTPHGAVVPEDKRLPAPSDPPDTAQRMLWHGVSVTAAGTVAGPSRAPYRADVALTVGSERRVLAVFGPRVWVQGPGGVPVPSAPQPFQSLPLDYAHAFGGAYDLPPGPVGPSGIPHPGGRITEPRNPRGKGFYHDAASALGRPLPSIEWADSLIRSVSDRPEPAGFAPCPDLEGLRFSSGWLARVSPPQPVPAGAGMAELLGRPPFALPDLIARLAHHAHGRLVFDRIPPRARVELRGIGAGTMEFAVPDLALSIAFADSALRPLKALRPSLRAIHLAADEGAVLLTVGATGTYAAARPPTWVVVTPAEGRVDEARV